MLSKHFVCICRHEFSEFDQEDLASMQRPKMTRVISFRVTDEDWFRIERAAAHCGDKPHDWCRRLTLQTAKMPVGMTPNDLILFRQVCHNLFLVENGFTLLAEDTLDSDLWKRYRAYAKTNLEAIADQALQEFSQKSRAHQS
jgi:hypothetical protein